MIFKYGTALYPFQDILEFSPSNNPKLFIANLKNLSCFESSLGPGKLHYHCKKLSKTFQNPYEHWIGYCFGALLSGSLQMSLHRDSTVCEPTKSSRSLVLWGQLA